jgi:hypothetical protein
LGSVGAEFGLLCSGCQRACGQGNLPEIIIGREAETVPPIFRLARRGETWSRSDATGNRWRTRLDINLFIVNKLFLTARTAWLNVMIKPRSP